MFSKRHLRQWGKNLNLNLPGLPSQLGKRLRSCWARNSCGRGRPRWWSVSSPSRSRHDQPLPFCPCLVLKQLPKTTCWIWFCSFKLCEDICDIFFFIVYFCRWAPSSYLYLQESILAWILPPFPSSILDEMRFEPATFRSWVKFVNH